MLRTPPHPAEQADRTERLPATIRAFAIETAAFPPSLAWSAPPLVDSFTTAASLVILWRYLRGDAWRDPWYARTPVGCATAVSVALNVAHAPDRTSAQLFAALPPVALLGALELLMSVARTGLPHTDRTTAAEDGSGDRTDTAANRSSVAAVAAADGSLAARPQLPHPTAVRRPATAAARARQPRPGA
jgi:hypothetical protein